MLNLHCISPHHWFSQSMHDPPPSPLVSFPFFLPCIHYPAVPLFFLPILMACHITNTCSVATFHIDSLSYNSFIFHVCICIHIHCDTDLSVLLSLNFGGRSVIRAREVSSSLVVLAEEKCGTSVPNFTTLSVDARDVEVLHFFSLTNLTLL